MGELASDIDIYIIPDKSETSDTPRGSARSQERLSLRDALITAVMLAFCTGIGYMFSDLGFSTANVIVIYIIGVLGIAMLTAGRSYSLAAYHIFTALTIENPPQQICCGGCGGDGGS